MKRVKILSSGGRKTTPTLGQSPWQAVKAVKCTLLPVTNASLSRHHLVIVSRTHGSACTFHTTPLYAFFYPGLALMATCRNRGVLSVCAYFGCRLCALSSIARLSTSTPSYRGRGTLAHIVSLSCKLVCISFFFFRQSRSLPPGLFLLPFFPSRKPKCPFYERKVTSRSRRGRGCLY